MSLDNNKDITERLKEYNEINRKIRDEERNKRFFKERVFNTIKYLIISLIVVVCVYPIFKETKEFKNVFFTYNIIEQLDYMYNGDFEIISPIIDEDNTVTPNGLYIVKDNKNNIEFKAYKRGNNLITDYDQYLYKKYALEYIDKYKVESFFYEDTRQENVNDDLYWFKFGIEIEDYIYIDERVSSLYKLIVYINNNIRKNLDFAAINYKAIIQLNGFVCYIDQDTYYHSLEYDIESVKINYINYLIDSNISDLKVPQKDMIEYYRPFQMNVIVNGNSVSTNVNGKEFQNFAHYNINKKDYEIRFGDVMNYLNCLDKIDRKANGAIVSFTYDGKILYFEDSKETKVKGNKVPYMWTIKMFEDFFDAEIIYDYDNKRIYINTIKE